MREKQRQTGRRERGGQTGRQTGRGGSEELYQGVENNEVKVEQRENTTPLSATLQLFVNSFPAMDPSSQKLL